MGLLFDSAADKARKASADAAVANRSLEEAAFLLRDVERRLLHVGKQLPERVPPSATSSIRRTMRNVRHHAEQMLTHMRKLDTHIRHMEEQLQHKK